MAAPALARSRFTHTVVPFRSIAGVRLCTTPSQIQSRFGKPDAVFHSGGKIDGVQYNANNLQMQIDFDTFVKGDPAQEITTNADDFHTVRNTRNGTGVFALRSWLHGYQHFGCSDGACHISKGGSPGADNSSETIFTIENGKVAGFAIAFNFAG